jgi:hypothetical protein
MENLVAYTYGALERALGATLKLSPEATVGMLRGRMIHLRRVGFGPRGQGYGSRITYDRETAVKWLLALLFENAGLSPLNIMGLVEGLWEQQIRGIVTRASKSKTDIFLVVSFSQLRDAAGVPVVPQVLALTAREAGKLLRWLTDERHVTVFNLTATLRIFDRELAAASATRSGGERASTSR